MKKTLVAMAALAVVGAASAQSSVTLYGRLNMGTAYSTTDTTTGAGVTTSTKNTQLAGAEGITTTQRLGMRGTEDLGGGLKLNFGLETKVFSDNSAAGTFGQTRTAMVQLAGGFGSVTLGTYLNALDDIGAYAAGAFSVGGGDILARVAGAGGATGLGIPTRSENSIAYRSPVFGGGFQGFIGTANQEVENTGGVANVAKTSGYMIGGAYDSGPLSLKLVYGDANGTNNTVPLTATNADLSDWGFTAKYDFGAIVPYFAWRQSETKGTLAGVAGTNNEGSVYEIGASFPMGAWTPYVTYASGDIKTSVNGVTGSDDQISGWQIGAYYTLSKRTTLTMHYGQDTRKSNIGLLNRVEVDGFALGIVHNF